ncbi:MAG: hypothetical protein ABIJ18_02650 [archaeon]
MDRFMNLIGSLKYITLVSSVSCMVANKSFAQEDNEDSIIVVEDVKPYFSPFGIKVISDKGIYLTSDPEVIFDIKGIQDERDLQIKLFNNGAYTFCSGNWMDYISVTEEGYQLRLEMDVLRDCLNDDGTGELELRVAVDGSNFVESAPVKFSIPMNRLWEESIEEKSEKGKKRREKNK